MQASRVRLFSVDVVRSLFALLMIASSGAHAQFPYGYGPYTPRNAPSVCKYIPPVRGNPPTSIAEAMLDAHNATRARMGVPPLVWSDQLAQVAQDWGNHLIATGGFSHRPTNSYGENLYFIFGGAASPVRAVSNWAREARGYDVRSNTCSGVCGHYTQIVWGTTKAVGCSFRQSKA